MKKRIWIPLLLSLLGVGAFLTFGQSKGTPSTAVNALKVMVGEFVRESKATGSVQARVYTLGFPRSGRVARVVVKEGQRVEPGTLLAELETQDEQIKLESAQENLNSVQVRLRTSASETNANLGKLLSSLKAARTRLELQRKLLGVGAAAQNDVDEAARNVNDLDAQLRVLEAQTTSGRSDLLAQYSARQSEIAALERSLAQAKLRAPVAGTVAKVSFLLGTESGTNTLELVEDATLNVKVRLAEADAALVKPGQPASIELDVAPGKILAAKVERLAVQGEVSGQGGSAVLPVVLKLLSLDARALAKPGLTAAARITTLRIPNARMIPLETVLEENKQSFVWLLAPATGRPDPKNPEFILKRQNISIKARNLTSAAVEGLEPGAQVVSLPSDSLKANDRVRVLGDAEVKP